MLAGATAVVLHLAAGDGQAAAERRIARGVSRLLAGIPQHGSTLGRPAAPVTIEVFADLKDPDSRNWWTNYLPAILKQDVRPGKVKLRFHSYKTNTYSPEEFVEEQTAALAAGAQDKLWNYADVFYSDPRRAKEASEFEAYATNGFLESVARQVSGLDLALWLADRHDGRREEQTTAEDQSARALGLHVTPSFRVGRSGGPLSNFSGHAVLKYGEQHPISFITARDVANAVERLARP